MGFSTTKLGGVALSALAFAAAGCDPCREFKNDPTKYEYYNVKDEKQGQKEAGPFVIAVYCKGTPKDAVREAVEAALKDAGGGSVGDLKSDDVGIYSNFGRWAPYAGETVAVGFKTKFKAKDLNTDDTLELVWKGSAEQRVYELNKRENDKLVPGYPSLAEVAGTFKLEVPVVYPGDGKKTLIAVTKLELPAKGGYKFKGSLPFSIRAKGKSEVNLEWDGKDDEIKPEVEEIQFYSISGFKGDPRDLQCKLMRKEVTTQNGTLLTFDLALSNYWMKVTSHSERAFKVFDCGGEISGVTGKIQSLEAKLPEGFPSPGKKYESRDALDKIAEKDQQPGDYYIKSDSDEQTSKITYRLYIRLPVGKDPSEVAFKITVQDASGKNQTYDKKWQAGN